jgi:hypothetical protein
MGVRRMRRLCARLNERGIEIDTGMLVRTIVVQFFHVYVLHETTVLFGRKEQIEVDQGEKLHFQHVQLARRDTTNASIEGIVEIMVIKEFARAEERCKKQPMGIECVDLEGRIARLTLHQPIYVEDCLYQAFFTALGISSQSMHI